MTDTAPIGHNVSPDYAETVAVRLEQDYAELLRNAQGLLEEARHLPSEIPDGDEGVLNNFTTLIKRMRDTTARIETFRITEKEPFYRGGQAVDGFFNRIYEKLSRRNSKDRPGAADVLQARVGEFLRRKEALERAIRERAAREAAEASRKEQERMAEERRKAEEAAAAAVRARKPENVAAHQAAARSAAEAAASMQAAADRAAELAEDARIDALARPADIARTRTEGGAVATLKQVPFVQISDVSRLNKELLWPHIKEEHLLMALKSWAKTRNHKVPMEGAIIEMRNDGVVI